MQDLIDQLKGIEGADEVRTALSARLTEMKAELDGAKGQLATLTRSSKAAEKARAELAEQLETAKAGSDEAVQKAMRAAAEARAALETERSGRRQDRIVAELSRGLMASSEDAPGITDATKHRHALAILTSGGLPEGVDVGEDGKVVGVDAAVKAFRDGEGAHFFAAGETKPAGSGGRAPGADPNATRGSQKTTPEQASAARIAAHEERLAARHGIKLVKS